MTKTITKSEIRTIRKYVSHEYAARNPRRVAIGADGAVTVAVDRMPNTDQPGRIFAGWDIDLLAAAHNAT